MGLKSCETPLPPSSKTQNHDLTGQVSCKIIAEAGIIMNIGQRMWGGHAASAGLTLDFRVIPRIAEEAPRIAVKA